MTPDALEKELDDAIEIGDEATLKVYAEAYYKARERLSAIRVDRNRAKARALIGKTFKWRWSEGEEVWKYGIVVPCEALSVAAFTFQKTPEGFIQIDPSEHFDVDENEEEEPKCVEIDMVEFAQAWHALVASLPKMPGVS